MAQKLALQSIEMKILAHVETINELVQSGGVACKVLRSCCRHIVRGECTDDRPFLCAGLFNDRE
jgi:hypothetical protein